jgi:NTP pyrophosphatase (non-canonical NTP hydrolase)
MDDKTYEQEASKTVSADYFEIWKRLNGQSHLDLLHGAIGCGTESGELLDAVKKYAMYGQPIDRVNIIEEVGDMMWYLNLALRSVGSTFAEAKELNIAKLEARYAGKFSELKATIRNLDAERATLEAK